MSRTEKDPDDTTVIRDEDGGGGDPSDSGNRVRDDAADLRARAEGHLKDDPWTAAAALEGLSQDDVQKVVHELKVHQIELEMQNEELRRTRAELEASHERYFDLFDLAPVGYFTLSEDALNLEANLTGATLLGAARANLVGRPFTEFILPEDQDVYYQHRRAVLSTNSPATCELRMVRADGSTFNALLESAPSLPVQNRATFRTVVSDITERTRVEAERRLLERQIQQLEKAESLGRMAGSMAHHFNNLLGVITGNVELAMEEASDDAGRNAPAVVRSLTDALDGARKATDLTQRLLAYLGHTQSEPILMDLSQIVQRGIPLLEIAIPLATELKIDLPSPGPLVRADPSDIQQVLTNLVTNAWEASEPETAPIHLAVSTVRASDIPEEHRFPVGWQPEAAAYACLQVRDKGTGIEPERLNEIFDPFFSTKSFGRGLGLSVALGTVKAHGGAMTVTTLPGQGSSFTLYLPVASAPAAAPGKEDIPEGVGRADRSPGQETSAEPATVLVVEDNEMVRRLAVRILARMGFRAVEAADGVEALEVFEAHRDQVGVVLCDVTMPRMGGWDTLAALRRIDSEIPVILTSGYEEASAPPGDHPDRPDAFLGKPWQLEQLRGVLVKVLESRGGSQSLGRLE